MRRWLRSATCRSGSMKLQMPSCNWTNKPKGNKMADVPAQSDRKWRVSLKSLLAASVGKPIVLRDLLTKLAPTIPLHHATRFYYRQKKGSDMSVLGMSVLGMREACLRAELLRYPLQWDVEVRKGITTPRTATFVICTRNCPGCGKPFVAAKDVLHCSRSCGTVRGQRLVKQAMRAAPRPENVARLIARVDRLSEELERLRDDLIALGHPRVEQSGGRGGGRRGCASD